MPFSITINPAPPPPGTAPSWFVSQAVKTWQTVAAASDQTLGFAFANPPQNGGAAYPGPGFDITKAYTGACVDQARGEYVMAANGGHANYTGNEVYACRIKSETPYWYRLLDRTPWAQTSPPFVISGSTNSSGNLPTTQGHIPAGFAAMYQDGRMRAQHGWHSNIFANGRVWYPTQQSPAGVGFSTGHAWSFDRSFAGLPQSPSRSPLAWANNAGPWEWLGTSDTGNRGTSATSAINWGTQSPAAFDPVSGLIWYVRENQETGHWASLNTATEAITSYGGGFGTNAASTWATVVYDPSGSDLWRYFVVNSRNNPNNLYILNLKQATPTWSTVTVSSTAASVTGPGAVYHPPSRSILCFDASDGNRGGTITKIRVPTTGNAYAGGTWQLSTINPAGGTADPSTGAPTGGGPAAGQYTWSKFNIIDDMGNGQSALVVCMDTTLPVYVYKLPTGELF